MQVSFHTHKLGLLQFRPHNMGGCYCQCPLAEAGLKRAVGAELDSLRKVKLQGTKLGKYRRSASSLLMKGLEVSVVSDGNFTQNSRWHKSVNFVFKCNLKVSLIKKFLLNS